MSQFESRPPKDNKPSRQGGGNDPNFNWRGIMFLVIGIALVIGAIIFRNSPYSTNTNLITNTQFMEYLQNDQIDKDKGLQVDVEDGKSIATLSGFLKTGKDVSGQDTKFSVPVAFPMDPALAADLEKKGMYANLKPDNNLLSNLLISFLPIALFLLILYFFFRQQIRMAGKGAMNFGKSKARMLSRDKNKITFKDVAGVEEAKDEVQEIVEFLQGPEEIPETRRAYPEGRADGRAPGHRQNAAGEGHRRRGGCAVLLDQRFGFRGNVRRCRREPRARHVRTGQEIGPVHYFHR